MVNTQLKVVIDSIEVDNKKKSFVITGWAINESDKNIPAIDVRSKFMKTVEIKKIYRADVNEIYKIKTDLEAGFQIIVTLNKKKEYIDLNFTSDSAQEKISIDTSKTYPTVGGTESVFLGKIHLLKKGLNYLKTNGIRSTLHRIRLQPTINQKAEDYHKWIEKNEGWDLSKVKEECRNFSYSPKISVLMPVYNVEEKWLLKCIQSVQSQVYENWELCIADDASTDKNVKEFLKKFSKKDKRIKIIYREENGHISKATNTALQIATGEYVALLDNDDELAPFAFYEIVKLLNEKPELDLIYSDEDKIDLKDNRFDPAFKPDWSPDLLLGTNYISHLGVYRRSIINEIGGFRVGYEGSQDYDLVLRFTEKTTKNKIAHIPKILYHWRVLPTSTAADQSSKGYAFEAGRRALEDALKRRNIKGKAKHAAGNGLYDVEYELVSGDLISIIIPTRDGYSDMKRCLDSIIEKSSYQNYEIIVADNGSTDPKMRQLYEEKQSLLKDRFIVKSIDIPFNYSYINNLAVQEARGKYLLFLNNDTEVITPNWLEQMLSFAQLKRIGCVGAKLYYPNHTIQHAGVILGLGGAAGHGHHTFPRGDFGYFGKLEINVNYLAVTAACLMVKKSDFDQVNGFDETLTVAFNDVDLCLKIFELGKDNVWLHGVELFHFESQTRGYEDNPEKLARFDSETKLMEQRWKKYIDNDPFYSPNLSRTGGHFGVKVD